MKTNSLKILTLATLGFTLTQGEGQAQQNTPPWDRKCHCGYTINYKSTPLAVVRAPRKASSPSSSIEECEEVCKKQLNPDVDFVMMDFFCTEAWVGSSPSKSK